MADEEKKKNGKPTDFLDECEQYLGSRNLYELLGLEKDKDNDEAAIKSAYRKKSLKVHPDRAPAERKEHAKRAFQTLTKVHHILTTPELREVYDETGLVLTDEAHGGAFEGFASYEEVEKYWRTVFPKISTQQLDDYLAKYVGSAEEVADLKALYGRFAGDLNLIYEYHYAYDEERVVGILNDLLKRKEIPALPAFVDEPARSKQKRLKRIAREEAAAEAAVEKAKKKKKKKTNKRRQNDEEEEEDEADEAEEEVDDDDDDDDDQVNGGGGGSLSALQAAIQSKNRNNFDTMLSSLEAKYGKKKQNKKQQPSNGKAAAAAATGRKKNGKNGGGNKKRRNK